MLRPTALVITAFLISGCATPDIGPEPTRPAPELSRVQAVQVGMKPAEVRGLLGEPEVVAPVEGRPDCEAWYYAAGVVVLEGGHVTFRHALPKAVAPDSAQ